MKTKHFFVVNPTAGTRSAEQEILEKLKPFEEAHDITLYVTRSRNDASVYVRSVCQSHQGPLRFYACGGDGTLNEVVNGAYGHAHAAVGCYPCGSGDDYIKYYGGKAGFMDIAAQLDGTLTSVDLMRAGDRLAINMVHFGFDSKVALTMQKVRRHPMFGGRRAYYAGVLSAFFQPFASAIRVRVDNEALNKKTLLLCTIACGQYVGGSFRCAPRSDNGDGLLDVCLVKPVSRFRFIAMIASYTRGEHLDDPRFGDIMAYRRGCSVRIDMDAPFPVSLDGELITASNLQVDVLPGAIHFVVPKGAVPIGQGGLKKEAQG